MSGSSDCTIVLYSMMECSSLQKINFSGKIYQIVINHENNQIIANTYEGTSDFFKIDINLNVELL